MRDTALIHAVDPASDRLTHDDVVAIHKAHQKGVPWDDIAETHAISRKQVQRIVQGRRWRDLHPTTRPELYEEHAREDAGEAAYKQGFADAVHYVTNALGPAIHMPDDWRERARH